MDFQALQIELNARLHGNITNASFLVQLKTWTNLARKYIVAMNPDWDFLQTTATKTLVANTTGYSLETDLVKLNQDEVILTDTRTPLEFLDVRKSGGPKSLTPGTPTHFRLAGYQTIQLLPPPSSAVVDSEATITYEYSKTFPTDMSASADTHDLPPHLEPVIMDLAESIGWLWLRQPQASQLAWSKALGTMQLLAPETEFFSKLALNIEPTGREERQGR